MAGKELKAQKEHKMSKEPISRIRSQYKFFL